VPGTRNLLSSRTAQRRNASSATGLGGSLEATVDILTRITG